MYKSLYETAIRENLDFVKCNYYTYFTDNSERKFIDRKVSSNQKFYENIFAPSDYIETVIDDWYLWNGIYRSKFIRDNNIRFSETSGAAFQDIGFLYQVTKNAERVRYVSESLYCYCVDRIEASSNSGRALKYIYQEYGILLNKFRSSLRKEKSLLYQRMVISFIRACQESSLDNLYGDDVKEIYQWFISEISKAEDSGYISESCLDGLFRETYRYLRISVNAYLEYRRERRRELITFLDECKGIIIFGCGNIGRSALSYLKKRNSNIIGFMDNNAKLWGKRIGGFEVLDPSNIESLSNDVGYVIANEKYAEDIIKQIVNHNKEVHFFEYDG